MKKTDFQQYRQYQMGYKGLMRFIIYGVILAILLYLIQYKSDKIRPVDTKSIEQFSLEDNNEK